MGDDTVQYRQRTKNLGEKSWSVDDNMTKVGSKKIVDRRELQTLDMGLQKFLEII